MESISSLTEVLSALLDSVLPVTAIWRVLRYEGGRPGVVRKTTLNPSANRAGWSAATPGIRVRKSPRKSSAFVVDMGSPKPGYRHTSAPSELSRVGVTSPIAG